MIYRIKSPENSYELLDLSLLTLAKLLGDVDFSLVRRFGRLNESLKDRWVVPECPFSDEFKQSKKKPDISLWGPFLLLSTLAYEKLASLLSDDGEFLEVKIDGHNYYLFNQCH